MRYLLSSIVYASAFAFILSWHVQTANAGCGKNAIGTVRTITVPTRNGPHYGRSHGGRQLALRHKEVVLTFDDGPIASKTRAVLRTLRQHCAKATFFPIGRMVSYNPKLIRSIVRAGHTVGSHTMTHRNLRRIGYKQAVQEIVKGFSITARATGGRVAPFFRFPGLNKTPAILALLKRHNIATFSIDVDSRDWLGYSGEKMANYILRELKYRRHRGIILFHDINLRTVRSLSIVLTQLKKNGYRVVRMRPSRNISLAQIKRMQSPSMMMMSKNSRKRKMRTASLGRVKTTRWKRKYRKRYRTRFYSQRAKKRLRNKRYRITRLRRVARLKRKYKKRRYRNKKRSYRTAKLRRLRAKRRKRYSKRRYKSYRVSRLRHKAKRRYRIRKHRSKTRRRYRVSKFRSKVRKRYRIR